MKIINAYAAGLFDGEGCISISKTNRGTYTGYQLVCTIGMTHKPALDFMQFCYGGSITTRRHYNQNAKQSWQWTVASDKAYDLLTRIRPHMYIKANEADIAIAFQEHIQNTRKRFGNGKDDPFRDSADEYRDQCYHLLRTLKKYEWLPGD